MARFPRSPGAGPKGMNNPIYWTRMHLQNQKYRATSQRAVEKFNERWNRLQEIEKKITEAFISKLNGMSVDEKKGNKLIKAYSEMAYWRDEIKKNIELAKNSDLSKYATRIKNSALLSIGLCIDLEVYSDIKNVEYVSNEKTIYIDGEEFYYLG